MIVVCTVPVYAEPWGFSIENVETADEVISKDIELNIEEISDEKADLYATSAQQQVANYALSKVGTSFANGYCQAFVSYTYANANVGCGQVFYCCATKAWQTCGKGYSISDIPLGATVYFSDENAGSNRVYDDVCKQYCGHVGIYVGDGYVVHGWGGKIVKTTLDYITKCGYPYRGWGWHANFALADIKDVSFDTIGTDTYRLVNNESYLTATADNNTTAVAVQAKNGASSQKFYISSNSRFSQSYVIKTQAYSSGRVLNVFTSGVSANGDSVTLYTSTTDASQSWKFEAKSGGYLIHPVDNTGLALTNNNGTAKVMTSTGASNQIWKLVSAVDQYTISYNANGGTGAPGNQTKNQDQSLTLSNTIPSRTGYIFQGWSTSADGSVQYNSGATYTGNADLTLYAVWTPVKYEIRFDANGGTGAPGTQHQTHDRYMTLSSVIPERTGYTFKGWSTGPDGNVSYQPGEVRFCENRDLTLFAVWEANKYIIYFDPNGGNVSESSRNITYGERYGNLPVPTRNGYAFDGWYTISGRFVSNWLIFEETSNQNLYAHWKTTSKLFDIVKVDKQLTLNIGESNTVHTWIYNSKDLTLSFSSENESIAYVTSDGKITGISNGNTNVNVTAYFDNSTKTESCYVTVTNQRVGYTVSYNANGGENAPTSQIKYYGQNLTLNGSVPSRFGYTFKGWSTSANGSVQYSPGSIYSGNAALTLYAVWQINSVTSVTLNLTSAALKKGETLKLTETVLPEDAANKNVTWSSSDTSVATVLNGTVTAVGSGTAKITVKTNDGGKTAVCTVTVTEPVLNAKAKFTISETSGRPGDTVKVKLSMKTDEKINAIAVSNISFDSEMLTFEGFSDYEHIAEMTVLPPSFDEEKMAIVIGLKNTAAFDSDICTLEFRINENAPEGVYSINADTIVKLSSAVVTSSVNPGKVTVRMQKLGDIDGNDTVDIDDAVLLFRHSMPPELYPISYAGNIDYNHDGNVDIDDAVMLFRYSMLPELYPID